jgi:hypothetical protein
VRLSPLVCAAMAGAVLGCENFDNVKSREVRRSSSCRVRASRQTGCWCRGRGKNGYQVAGFRAYGLDENVWVLLNPRYSPHGSKCRTSRSRSRGSRLRPSGAHPVHRRMYLLRWKLAFPAKARERTDSRRPSDPAAPSLGCSALLYCFIFPEVCEEFERRFAVFRIRLGRLTCGA